MGATQKPQAGIIKAQKFASVEESDDELDVDLEPWRSDATGSGFKGVLPRGRRFEAVIERHKAKFGYYKLYDTAEAAGQNMVTMSTDAACKYIVKNLSNGTPHRYLVESNFNADKNSATCTGGLPNQSCV